MHILFSGSGYHELHRREQGHFLPFSSFDAYLWTLFFPLCQSWLFSQMFLPQLLCSSSIRKGLGEVTGEHITIYFRLLHSHELPAKAKELPLTHKG